MRYIEGVQDGTLTVGRLQRLAVERHLHDLKHAHERGYHFDEKKAEAAVSIFPVAFTHTKGEWAGKPFQLSDNQAFIVWCVFGWRRNDGTRRFRHVYICIARKWGKSEFAAALGLLCTSFDDPLEPGAEVYCAATKEDQAKIVHNVAQQMARTSPILREVVNVLAKSIATKPGSPQPASFFKPIGSDSKTSDGLNLHAGILDEIHEWQERHRGLFEKLTTAHGARRQPLIVTITTAGTDKSDIWNEMDNLCVTALERFADDSPPGDNRFAFIARLDEERVCVDCMGDSECDTCGGSGKIEADDPFDPANWPKANPNYPVTPKHDFLAEQAADAKENAAYKHSYLRYHCNLRVTSLNRAIMPEVWTRARGELSDWSKADVVCGGWDMGGLDDLGAIGYAARFETGEKTDDGDPIYRFEVDARGYINAGTDRELAREPWASWIDQKILCVATNELREMREQVNRDYREDGIDVWGFDQANSRDFAQSVEESGAKPVKFLQSATFWTVPMTRFLTDLRHGRIKHDGNPLLEWAAGNMVVENISRGSTVLMRPDKLNSPDKIDPMVAVLMAYAMACAAPARPSGNLLVY